MGGESTIKVGPNVKLGVAARRFELSELIGFFYRCVGTLDIDWHHKFGSEVGIPAFDNSGTEFFPAIRAVFQT
jgi:hypothetical protein